MKAQPLLVLLLVGIYKNEFIQISFMLRALLIIVLMSSTTLFFAQDNIPLQLAKKRGKNPNLIEYRKATMFKKMPGRMYFREKGTDDVYRKIGFYGKALKPYIDEGTTSMKYFKRYRFKRAMDDFTSVGTGIAGIIYLGFAIDNASKGFGPRDSFFGRKNVGICIVTYALMIVGNGYFGPSSENDLLHSILLGNGFNSESQTGLRIGSEHGFVGLTYVF